MAHAYQDQRAGNRVCDYFAVCGLKEAPEIDSTRALAAERARDIMDVAVVFDMTEAPELFSTIMYTPMGRPANFDQMQVRWFRHWLVYGAVH